MSCSETSKPPTGEIRALSTAGGGAALSTTVAHITIPKGARTLQLFPRSFAGGCLAVQILFNPLLAIIKTTDALATITDYTDAAQDGDAATDVDLSSLDTLANGDYLLIGARLPFRGVTVDIDAANGNASVLTVKYWDGNAWTNITATDGTIAAVGKTMGVDGAVTWTVPSDWTAAQLKTIASPGVSVLYQTDWLYWTRWEVSAALDATTTCNSMMPLGRSTAYYELVSGQVQEEHRIVRSLWGIGSIEARTDQGTANLIVNARVDNEGRFV